MSKQQETLFKEKVLKDLKSLPLCWFVKIQQVSKRGTPDILLCVAGKFVALELKTETGKLSALQEFNLEQIANAKGIGLIATPSTWPVVFNLLKHLTNKKKEKSDV